LAGLAAHHIVEEEELHNDLAEVREVRRNAEEEEVAADSHHRAVEVEEDHQEEDNGLEVADTHLAEEDTVLEEVADTRRRAAEVGDIDHNLAAAAAVGRREHRNLGKTWRLVLLCLCNVM
jgi:hypothetical protein